MTVNPVSTATPRPRLVARALARIPHQASALAVVALFGGTAWHVAVAAHAAIRPVASAPAPAFPVARRQVSEAAPPVSADDQDDAGDEGDQQADDGQPEEPLLEQIPVTESPDPQALAT